MEMKILFFSIGAVIFTLGMTLYQEFRKKEHASEWALACMVTSLLNMILLAFIKTL